MLLAAGMIAVLLTAPARLPVRHYTSADGLAEDRVYRTAFDPDGFLWIATPGGLSRFDGERFVTFGEAEGLRGRTINDIAFGVDGSGWVATESGLFWFRPDRTPASGALFRELPLGGTRKGDEPYRLVVSRAGAVWVGTLRRLCRITGAAPSYRVESVELRDGLGRAQQSRVQSLREDPEGAIWVGTHRDGIFRVRPGGGVDHCPDDVPGASFVRDFLFPPEGGVWTAFFGGVAIFDHAPFPGRPTAVHGKAEGVSIDTQCLLADGPARVLVATTTGIVEMARSPQGWRAAGTIDRRSGLPGDFASWLLRDAEGNLWVSLGMRGLATVLRNGISRLPDAEEPGAVFVDLKTDREGRLVAFATKGAMELTAYHPGGERPGPFPVSLPKSRVYLGWGGAGKVLRDSRGAWWLATGAGALRYDDPQGIGPRRMERPADARYGLAEGLAGSDAYVLGEDAGGDVWLSANPLRDGGSSVSRWSRATGRVETFPVSATGTRSLAWKFLTTPDRSLWIGFYDSRVIRFREGRFEAVELSPGDAPEVTEMYVDGGGHLWAIGRGAYVCEDPAAAKPRFVRHPIPGEPRLHCMIDDREGRLWFGTNRGVLRLDPSTGHVRRFTADDGLVGNTIALCARDGNGALWFSDLSALTRLMPQPDREASIPDARLREVRIAGEAVPLPWNGAAMMGPLVIPPHRRQLSVEFFAVHHGTGPPPLFQYRLEGADTSWSAPATNRSIQYAHLAAGRYRFLVRTVGEDGTPSPRVAVVPLRVLAPIWQRGWFLALALLTAGGLGYAGYRLRVRRAVAVERIRTRIATDLHDDIGSSLSQISILSQLAHRQAAEAGGRPPESLERITALSGELIDAMSDVVWAISPRSDTVAALVHRTRRFASELFADGAVELALALPEGDDEPIDPDVRRQLYMVFKEALHNARRHAAARHVTVALRREGSAGWLLRVEDDGRGFDTERESEGHGLRSMRRRAERLGGTLGVLSSPQGTTVELKLSNR